jgi:hypothetical protein
MDNGPGHVKKNPFCALSIQFSVYGMCQQHDQLQHQQQRQHQQKHVRGHDVKMHDIILLPPSRQTRQHTRNTHSPVVIQQHSQQQQRL